MPPFCRTGSLQKTNPPSNPKIQRTSLRKQIKSSNTIIYARLLEFDAESKIFTDDHLIALKHALKDRPHTLFTIDTPLTPALYAQMREKGSPGTVLIVYTPSDDPDFLSMLASLKEVDFILTSKESIDALNTNVPV